MPPSCCRRVNVAAVEPPALGRVPTDSIPDAHRLMPTGDPQLDQILRKRRVLALERLEEFKRRYPPETLSHAQQHFLTEATFLRYLEARDGDVSKASEMLTNSLKWRAERLDDREITCPSCNASPHAHCFIPIGEDTRGWQMVYSCAARASDKNSESSVVHMSATLEKLFDRSAKPGKIAWLIDMHGFGWRDLDTSMATTVVPMFSNQYPERMGQIVIIDPPASLKFIWEGLVALLDPVTRRKIKMIRNDKLDYFRSHCTTAAQYQFLQTTLATKAVPGNLPIKETERVVAESAFVGL
jgi:hypothetical protein